MKKKIPKNRKCGNLFLELEKGKIGENGKLQENIENPKNVIYNIIFIEIETRRMKCYLYGKKN